MQLHLWEYTVIYLNSPPVVSFKKETGAAASLGRYVDALADAVRRPSRVSLLGGLGDFVSGQ